MEVHIMLKVHILRSRKSICKCIKLRIFDVLDKTLFFFSIQVCSGRVDVHVVHGDHETFILGKSANQVCGIITDVMSK